MTHIRSQLYAHFLFSILLNVAGSCLFAHGSEPPLRQEEVKAAVPAWISDPETLTWALFEERHENVGVDQLIVELEKAEEARFQTLTSCLRLSDYVLRSSPQELGFQIEMRCLELNDPVIQQLLATKPNDTAIDILSSSFDRPLGPALRRFPKTFDGSYVLKLSPDGQVVASAYDSWDVPTGRHLQNFEARRDNYQTFAFANDSRVLAFGAPNNGIDILDGRTGKIESSVPPFESPVKQIVFAPGDQTLVVGDSLGQIHLIARSDGRCILKWQAHDQEISSLSLSQNRKLASTGAADESIRIWDLDSGLECGKVTGLGVIQQPTLAPSGNWMVCRYSDDNLAIIDLRSGKPIIKHLCPGFSVQNVLFCEDDGDLIGSRNGFICFVDLETASIRTWHGHDASITGLQLLGGSTQLVAIDQRFYGPDVTYSTRIWDVEKLRESAKPLLITKDIRVFGSVDEDECHAIWESGSLRVHRKHHETPLGIWETALPNWVKLSSDGEWAAISDSGRNGVHIWHVPSQEKSHTILDDRIVPDSQAEFVRVGHSWQFAVAALEEIYVWDINSGEVVANLLPLDQEQLGTVHLLNSLPDEPWLWATFDGGRIELWDLESRQRLASFGRPKSMILETQVTTDRRTMLINDYFGGYTLWDIRTSQLLRSMTLEPGGAATVLSPDNTMIAAIHRYNTLVLWDIQSDQCVKRLTFDATLSRLSWIEDILTVHDNRGRTHRLRVLPRTH